MNPQKFKQIEEIYHEAVELDDQARHKLIERKCGDDPELRKEVESLLSTYETGSFIDRSPEDLAASLIQEREKSNLVGAKIGRYRVLSVIGEGGMGEVYLARDEELKRKVALKVLPPEMVENSDRLQRFVHEARAASALNHPNILTIYEVGQAAFSEETVHYISMEYIEGEIFNSYIYEKRVSLDKLIKYLCQVGEGVSKAHIAGIAHRDLKPENVMINSDGYAKVLDFGLAKLVDKEAELNHFQEHQSRSGVILGTVGYMSPEQARGSSEIDARSDIFSFGCILYETLAKEKPFVADSAIDCLHKIIHEDPIPLNEQNCDIPGSLQEITEMCLAKSPEHRYQTIREVVDDLTKLNLPIAGSLSSESVRAQTETLTMREAAPTRTISRPAFEQRKQVTLLYADIETLSELFETLDPEESARYWDELWSQITMVVSDGDGEIHRRFPDGFSAIWGSSMTREGDPERAIRTALSLQKSILNYFKKNLSCEFDPEEVSVGGDMNNGLLRIGLDTGMSLISLDETTEKLKLSGPVLNVAKRLAIETKAGEVLVSHGTYRHIRGVFDITPQKISHKLKLKKETRNIRVYRIDRSKSRAFRLETRGVGGIETNLIGRQGEMDKLLDALYSVFEESELQAITVLGEAGLGKSRLLYEFRDQLELIPEKVRVFNARAYEGLNNLPFSLLRDVFAFRFEIFDTDPDSIAREKFGKGIRDILSVSTGISESEIEELTHFLGNLISLDYSGSVHFRGIKDDPRQFRERALSFAQQFFDAVSRDSPVVINLDDIHWADEDSLSFFEQLITAIPRAKLLVLGFARPSLLERRPHWMEGLRNHTRIHLDLLSDRETRILVKDVLRRLDKPAKKLVKLVVKTANGNPFYAEELIKMMIDQRIITTEFEKWAVDETRLNDLPMPSSLNGVLQARFDQLSTMEKVTLQYAAVIGFEFWIGALNEFEEERDQEAVLRSLREKEIIYRHENSVFEDSREYVFKHLLFRDVVYETVLLKDRKRYHQRVAEWLVRTDIDGKNDHSSMIAEHFERAGSFEDASVWYGRAGDYARKTHSPEAAAVFFSKALSLSGQVQRNDKVTARELDWRKRLGNALHRMAKFEESIVVFEKLLKQAEKAGDQRYQAEAFLGLSFANLENGNNRTALETATRIEELPSDENDLELQILKAKGLYRKARALYSLGEFTKVVELGEKVLGRAKHFDRSGAKVLANSYHILAVGNMSLGNFDKALEYEKKEIEVSRSIGDARTVANGLNSIGEQMRLRGNAPKAIEYYKQALSAAKEIGAKNSEVMIMSNMGGAEILLGDFVGAERSLRKVFELTGEQGHFILPETYRFLAESLNGQGKTKEALESGKESLRLSQAAENNENVACAWRVLGSVIAKLGEAVEIEGKQHSSNMCFEIALQTFEESAMKAEFARTLRDFAIYSKPSDCRDKLESSRAIFLELGMENELERTKTLIEGGGLAWDLPGDEIN
ncbi:MAG: protein kinase [Pyrinomonadaceae bacterium]|nr:protein kinase [Pyrinomonadaceae bacterium]